MGYKVFLFDLDGTLLDTSPGILHAMRCASEEMGLPVLSDEIAKRFIGPPVTEPANEFYGMDEAAALAYADVFDKYYLAGGALEAVVYPWIPETVDAIHAAGALAAVATAKTQGQACGVLDHFGLTPYFDCIATIPEKIIPKGEIIQNALAELDVADPRQAVMFGDSIYDGIGAAAAGTDFAAAMYGFGFYRPDALQQLAHIAAFDTSRQLFDWVCKNV